MKETDALFLLIKSLTKSEKRYFKLNASFHKGEKNYVLLFDAIEKQKIYDEYAIKKLFPGEKFIKHFAFTKNYLHNLILKTLHSYNENVDSGLNELLHYVDILFKKGLYEQCKKILERAKKLTVLYEKEIIQLQIYKWEKELIKASWYGKMPEKMIDHILEGEQLSLERIKNEMEYEQLSTKISLLFRHSIGKRTNEELEKYKSVFNDPLLKNEKSAFTKKSKYLFYKSNVYYHLNRGHLPAAYPYSRDRLLLFESFPKEIIAEEMPEYINALNSLMFICSKLKKYEEEIRIIKTLRGLTNKYPVKNAGDIEVKIFERSYIHELEIHIVTGDFNKGIFLVKDIEQGLEKFKGKIDKVYEIVFYYNVAYLYFGAAEYKKALHWLNKILNDNSIIEVAKDIFCYARLMAVMVHYEMGNEDIMEYLVKSAHRFLNKKDAFYKFEELLLNFFRTKLTKSLNKKELIPEFKKLKEKLIKLFNDPDEKKALDYFDIISWLDSKIENRSFAEIKKRISGNHYAL